MRINHRNIELLSPTEDCGHPSLNYCKQCELVNIVTKAQQFKTMTSDKQVEVTGSVASDRQLEVTGSVASDKQVEVTGSVVSDKQIEVNQVSRIRLHEIGQVCCMVVHNQCVYVIHIFLAASLDTVRPSGQALLNWPYHQPIGVGREI